MSSVNKAIDRIAAEGSRLFEATGPTVPGDEIMRRVRRAVRRRIGAQIGAGVAIAALVAGSLALVLPRIANRDLEPAQPVPGTLLWSADIGAEMWGSPVVLGDRVYVGADDGTVRAFDLANGAPAWTFDAGAAVRATITTDGSLLFVAVDDNTVLALRDDGAGPSIEWSTQAGSLIRLRDTFDTYGSAPTVADGVVIVGSQDGGVYAFDRATGEEAWVLQTSGAVRSTAAAMNGVAYIGSDDGSLYAIDIETGNPLWSYSFGNPVTPSPAVVGDLVVVGSRGTSVVALETATGTVRWQYSLAPSWAESSPIALGDALVFGSSSAGTVTAVDAETGSLLWTTRVGGLPWARPAVADGTVYVTTALVGRNDPQFAGIRALDGSTGEAVWGYVTGESLNWTPDGHAQGALASPTVSGRLVLVAGLDGVLYCLAR